MANPDICVRFGRRVQRERKKRDLKQIDLSVATGLTRSTVSQIENGRQEVGLRTIEKIANAMEIPIVSLFRGL